MPPRRKPPIPQPRVTRGQIRLAQERGIPLSVFEQSQPESKDNSSSTDSSSSSSSSSSDSISTDDEQAPNVPEVPEIEIENAVVGAAAARPRGRTRGTQARAAKAADIEFIRFAQQVGREIESMPANSRDRVLRQQLLDDAMEIDRMIKMRDQKRRNKQPTNQFITDAGPTGGQFPSDAAADLAKHWTWLHDYMNNSIVRDFFNRFSHCGVGAAPLGKMYGDARSCHQTGVRAGRVYSRTADESPGIARPARSARRPVTRSQTRVAQQNRAQQNRAE
jgi:hypothetical protein